MTLSVLMVAEKPSICTSIAQALSNGVMESRGRTPPVHEFEGTFQGQRAFIRVTSVTGHVFSTDFPAAYQHWDAVEPVELFGAPVISSPEGKGAIVKHLEREAKGMDKLVLWLDCDREGENICFEVIRCVDKAMNKSNSKEQKIFRARFSAVTAKDIQRALSSLVHPNENESLAVEARQELDLKIGVAFSRFQTRYFQGKYGDLDSAVISYGPCQTPTLGFCVQRHDFIQSFTPEPYWGIDIAISAVADAGSSTVAVEWSRKRLFDEASARVLLKMIVESKGYSLECCSVNVTTGKHPRPQPMNTVQMLKMASKSLGIGPHSCMRAAEHLYLSGYLSYPRTESTSYPSSYDFNDTLRSLFRHWSLSDYARNLHSKKYTSPRQGHDAGDHPPITPVGVPAGPHALAGDELRLYDMVVRQFLASISPDETYEQTVATFEASCGESFTARGKRQLDPGYTVIYNIGRGKPSSSYDSGGEDDDEGTPFGDLPSGLKAGMMCPIVALKIKQGFTKPPGPLTESELISLMEKHGIGTDASIPTHINNIIVRNYVTLGSNRTLIPTALGVVLVHGYYRIDPDLVLPDIRSAVETFCNMIAKGEVGKKEVVDHSLACFEAKFRHFSSNIDEMNSLFEASFSPLAVTGKFLSKCGKCLRYMRYIPLPPQRLYCPNCEETYSLPRNGTIKLYKEIRCPLDQFELVFFSLGNTASAQGKGYPLCPYCYNHPPEFDELQSATMAAERMSIRSTESKPEQLNTSTAGESDETTSRGNGKKEYIGMGCNSCMNPGCYLSAVHNSICTCPHIPDGSSSPCGGMLVFDENSKPNWKLACNKCNTLFRFHGSVHHIRPAPHGKICQECGQVRLMCFEFSKLKPLPNGDTSKTGCIVCDDTLNSMTEKVVGRSINLSLLRQIRHKRGGGGRGRKGRGRGRGSNGDAKMSFSEF